MDWNLDEKRLARVKPALEGFVEKGAFPGGVYAIAVRDGIVKMEAFGRRDDDPSLPATVDTLYDLASVTKSAACAPAVVTLIERGLLVSGEEARNFFPEASLPHWAGITIHHLLTHTSGLPAWKALHEAGPAESKMLGSLFSVEMKAPPGEAYEYSCLGYITLGKIVERVLGEPLDTFLAREVYEPLNTPTLRYRRISTTPQATPEANIAPNRGGDRDRGKIYGEVHDGNASGLDGVSGNAGLFGTAADIVRYGRMLLNGGSLDGVRIFGPATVKRMLTRQIDMSVGGHTWGFFCAPNGMLPSGDLLRDGSAGHSGFTGTSLLIHPEYGLVTVLLTNRCLWTSSLHLSARQVFHNIVASALEEA